MKNVINISFIALIAVFILFIYKLGGLDPLLPENLFSDESSRINSTQSFEPGQTVSMNQMQGVSAVSNKAEIGPHKWIIACETDFPPYNFIDNQGNKTGLDTELISAVLKHLNVNFEIKTFPWKRVVYSLDNNYVDCAFQFVGKPERFEKYWMIGPLRSGITLFAVKKDSSIRDYTSLQDLTPYAIGYALGYSYTPEFDSALFLKKEELRNNTLLVNALVHNRVDLMIGDLNTLSYTAKNNGQYSEIRFLPTILKEVPRYIAFPRERKEQAELFAQGLESIKENGTYARIMKAWQ